MKQVIIGAVIALMAVLLAGPAAVQAQDLQDYDYVTNADNTITLTRYIGTNAVVTIPTNITGLPVIRIGQSAFSGLTNVTSVTIPGSVTNIGDSVFERCYGLTNASLANGVLSIGSNAFESCTSLTSVTLPGTLASIGASAFLWCSWLPTIVLPGSVTSIGDSAFKWCYRLTNATFANGLLSIGDSAFSGCISLTSAAIPGSVTNVGDSAFAGCNSLTSLTIPTNLSSIGNSVFGGCAALPNVTIPGSVTSLGSEAFGDCGDLSNVTIPASVTNFAADAFRGCLHSTNLYFQGNAPTISPINGPNIGPPLSGTVYYLPGTTGWSNTFGGDPAVLWNPLIQTGDGSFGVQTGQFGFNITGTSNIPIVVEASASLAGPVWTPLQSLTLTNGSYYFSEPFQPGSPQRYYRITSQ